MGKKSGQAYIEKLRKSYNAHARKEAIKDAQKIRAHIPSYMESPPKDARQWWARYRAYMRSPEWREFRAQVLVEAGWRCRRCGKQTDLEVHHKNYANVGREELKDVMVLCIDCHDKEHPNHPRRRYNKGRG